MAQTLSLARVLVVSAELWSRLAELALQLAQHALLSAVRASRSVQARALVSCTDERERDDENDKQILHFDFLLVYRQA